MKKRPSYTKEFKLEAVRLLERDDKPAAVLARELGIKRNQLYKWQKQLSARGKDDVFPGHGRRAGSEAEIARLRREVAHLQEENAKIWGSRKYADNRRDNNRGQ